MLSIKVDGPGLCEARFEPANKSVGVVGFEFGLRGQQRRRIGIQRITSQGLDVATVRVAITEVHGVVPVKLVIAFDNVLEFAVLRRLVRAQVIEANRVCARTTGDIPGYREEITEGRNAVDREVFNVEGIRDSKLVRSQECYPDVPNCVRSLHFTRNVVKAGIKDV